MTLSINQQKYFAFGVDDVIKYQSAVELLQSATSGAGYALADEIDKYIVSLYPNESPLEATSSKLEKMVLDVATILDNANADNDRYIVLNPTYANALVSSVAEKMTDNKELLTNGYLGKLYGIAIYKSVNVEGGVYGCINAITLAKQITTIEQIRNPNTFADCVRGLCVFGGLVTRPNLCNTISIS